MVHHVVAVERSLGVRLRRPERAPARAVLPILIVSRRLVSPCLELIHWRGGAQLHSHMDTQLLPLHHTHSFIEGEHDVTPVRAGPRT
eukprot:scaffold13435_cov33-Tisochrysis_lutea.AAC.4